MLQSMGYMKMGGCVNTHPHKMWR